MQFKVGVTLGMRQKILIPIKAYCSKLLNGDRKLQEFILQLWLPKQPKCQYFFTFDKVDNFSKEEPSGLTSSE